MRYVLLVYDRPDSLEDLSEPKREAVYREYESLSEIAGLVGHRLQPPPTARTLRVRAGELELQSGPFPHDSIPLAGFYLLESADLEGAIEIAGRIPAAQLGGAVEIRPLVTEP